MFLPSPPAIAAEFGSDYGTVGLAVAGYAAAAAILQLLMGPLSDRFGRRFLLGSFLAGRYAGRFALTTTMLAGRISACAGVSADLAMALLGLLHPVTFFGWCMFAGLGNGLTLSAARAAVMSVRPGLAGSAAACRVP